MIYHCPQNRLALLDSLPKHSVCAELGVFTGDVSVEILTRCQPSLLYLVDTFSGIVVSGDADGNKRVPVDMGQIIPALSSKLRLAAVKAGTGVWEVVRKPSVEFLGECVPGSLDMVYIDTTHEHTYTYKELHAAYRAVRSGGYILGHDYCEEFPGVIMAVGEACHNWGLDYTIWYGDKIPSYEIRKP